MINIWGIPVPPEKLTERDIYAEEGKNYERLFDYMKDRGVLPPSLDVFQFGYKKAKKTYKSLSLNQYAEMISERRP